MADGARQDVLGRKAQAAQRAFEARGMSPAKALRRALSRSADILWDLALVSQGESLERLDQDGVIAALDDNCLMLLLDGPDGALGVACVERAVLTGVIEVQTIQQVTTMPVEDRPLTGTDAAMIAPLIDLALERFAANLADHPLLAQLEGFRFGAMIEDKRSAGLLLDAAAYRAFRVTVDLALGRRKGMLSIFLPERVIRRRPPEAETDEDACGPHEAALERLPVRLDAVLGGITMTLSEAQSLAPGDLVALSVEALDSVALCASKGSLVARGRIGQLNGMRAIRINWPEGPPGAAPSPPPPAAEEPLVPTFEDPAEQAASPSFAETVDATPEPEIEALPDLPPLDLDDDEGGAFDFSSVDAAAEGDDGAFDFSSVDAAASGDALFEPSSAEFDTEN